LFGNRLFSMKRFYQFMKSFIREGKLFFWQMLWITDFRWK
jgi:hypothetical protein